MRYLIKFASRYYGWFVFRTGDASCYLHMDLTWHIIRTEGYFATIEIAEAALMEKLGVESLEAIDVEY